MGWFVCYWLMYSLQRFVNVFKLDDSVSMFNIEPVTTIIQLSLEFILSILIYLAIYFGQKKRFTSQTSDADQMSFDNQENATV